MDVESKGIPLATFLLFLLLFSLIFPPPSLALNPLLHNLTQTPSNSYSSVLPLRGNVHTTGSYTVTLKIGSLTPIAYDGVVIDTGSDISWIQCDYEGCKGCNVDEHKLYKPRNNNVVKCGNPLCRKFSEKPIDPRTDPKKPCEYGIKYADQTISKGVYVEDHILLESTRVPEVVFGCANDLKHPPDVPLPKGILGLSNGKSSFLSQLHSKDLFSNVMGHCLIGKEGGYLFFGDKFIQMSGIVWTPIVQSSWEKSYDTGPADLYYDRQATSVKGLQLTFDSGTLATQFNSQAYKAVVNRVDNDLRGMPFRRVSKTGSPLKDCWEGERSFKSVSEVKDYFKPLSLSFKTPGNPQFPLPPEAYLTINQRGYVCLGILHKPLGDENVIGAVSLQDKLVIYDNENHRIGWLPADCDKLPNS